MSLEGKIKKAVPLLPKTSFKIGGIADLFFEAATKSDIVEIFQYIREHKLKYFLLGGGSNIIINDKGFRGIIIKITNTDISFNGESVNVGAGKNILELNKELKEASLSGLEWTYGIPATIGGIVVNNGGAFGREIKDNIVSVEVYDIKRNIFTRLKKDECGFNYRNSLFKKDKNFIVWEVELKLVKRERELIEEEMKKNLNYRKENQPVEYPSAGSFFKNIKREVIGEDEWRRIMEIMRKKISAEKFKTVEARSSLPSGLLIEIAGLKGRSIGGAKISDKHGNFIINSNGASAEDVIMLSSLIKQKIRHKFNIQLHEEIEYIGF